MYKVLTVDVDKKVREATQACHGHFMGAAGRRAAPQLKRLLPAWLQAQHDEHAPAAAKARASLESTFPESKLPEALAFCKAEVAAHLLEDLLGDAAADTKAEDAEEREQRRVRVATGSLRGLEAFAARLPDAQRAWLAEALAPLLAAVRGGGAARAPARGAGRGAPAVAARRGGAAGRRGVAGAGHGLAGRVPGAPQRLAAARAAHVDDGAARARRRLAAVLRVLLPPAPVHGPPAAGHLPPVPQQVPQRVPARVVRDRRQVHLPAVPRDLLAPPAAGDGPVRSPAPPDPRVRVTTCDFGATVRVPLMTFHFVPPFYTPVTYRSPCAMQSCVC
ncbi:uncharacterized protein LOC113227296 [Hyposmocoma kahamanoa]|uniref:uncharacterized protein LOC113227296 n=1 Tax=Hyposmocoma kahamanoa TaxID=1477025 RepID=UPI000E6D6FBA|nr:uncharacterized protein LOC113227296 [Hyposmocoma kahamanoa]